MGTTYDDVAYPSHPFRQTHPVRMALPAALFGMDYAPVETARILEIGCGEGGNIIPMALAYPRAQVVGFDLAASAIAAGQATAAALGLDNIQLKTLDILQADGNLGQFDYIIAHGVYSWVPEPVREGVLRIIDSCLSPVGLAFVSYNAMPGCHMRLMVREMMAHHLRGREGFEDRLAGAREFLTLFIAHAADDDATTAAIKTYCRSMLERDPRVLFHDELGPVYQPFYLHEFATQAARHDLAFLGESDGPWWREELFPSSRGKAVGALVGDDALELHQYVDFLSARLFRQTILCRSGRVASRVVDPGRMRKLWVTGGVKCAEAAPDLRSTAPLRFEFEAGAAIALEAPVLKQALFAIASAWPRPSAVADLPDDTDVDEALLQLFTAGHLELMAGAPVSPAEAGDRPVSSPLARLQLTRGATTLCTLNHTLVTFEDEPSRRFLGLLDGTRTRQDLAAAMSDVAQEPGAAKTLVDDQLKGLARMGLLVQ